MKNIINVILFVILAFAARTFAMDKAEIEDEGKKTLEEIGYKLNIHNKIFIFAAPIYIQEIKNNAMLPGPDQKIWKLFDFPVGQEVDALHYYVFVLKYLNFGDNGIIMLSPEVRESVKKHQKRIEGEFKGG